MKDGMHEGKLWNGEIVGNLSIGIVFWNKLHDKWFIIIIEQIEKNIKIRAETKTILVLVLTWEYLKQGFVDFHYSWFWLFYRCKLLESSSRDNLLYNKIDLERLMRIDVMLTIMTIKGLWNLFKHATS